MNTKCRQAIETYRMLRQGDHVIVGLSGGADSCAMLHFLCGICDEFALHITAIHVNHMIRGEEALRDAAFAEDFCRELNVDFRLYERDVPKIAKERGMGLEECGRDLRYDIFRKEAAPFGGKIATAHTLSDSAETVLLHMIRGCSVNGLRGIAPVRGNIIRPLILCGREDIEAYCAAHQIRYVTDSTNLQTEYARNRIRLQMLPLMREMNPAFTQAIGRLSESASEDELFFEEAARPLVEAFLAGGSAEGLFSQPWPIVSRALTEICRQKCGFFPEYRHLTAMRQCLLDQHGSVNLPRDVIFSVKQNEITLFRAADGSEKLSFDEYWHCDFGLVDIEETREIITPCGQKIIARVTDKNKYDNIRKIHKNVFDYSLDYDKIKEASFRFRKSGDVFCQAGRGHTKTLKKLFNERKIPVKDRQRLPMLVTGGCIVWICSIGVAEGFQVTEDTDHVLMISVES